MTSQELHKLFLSLLEHVPAPVLFSAVDQAKTRPQGASSVPRSSAEVRRASFADTVAAELVNAALTAAPMGPPTFPPRGGQPVSARPVGCGSSDCDDEGEG